MRTIQPSFVAGVVSPALYDRVQTEANTQGLSICDNAVITHEGTVKKDYSIMDRTRSIDGTVVRDVKTVGISVGLGYPYMLNLYTDDNNSLCAYLIGTEGKTTTLKTSASFFGDVQEVNVLQINDNIFVLHEQSPLVTLILKAPEEGKFELAERPEPTAVDQWKDSFILIANNYSPKYSALTPTSATSNYYYMRYYFTMFAEVESVWGLLATSTYSAIVFDFNNILGTRVKMLKLKENFLEKWPSGFDIYPTASIRDLKSNVPPDNTKLRVYMLREVVYVDSSKRETVVSSGYLLQIDDSQSAPNTFGEWRTKYSTEDFTSSNRFNNGGILFTDNNKQQHAYVPPDLKKEPYYDPKGLYKPKCLGFFEQRLILAGGTTLASDGTENGYVNRFAGNRIVFSRVGDLYNFNKDTTLTDGSAMQIDLAIQDRANILHIVGLNGLHVFTDKSEWFCNGSITPSSVSFYTSSNIGSSEVPPIVINNSIFFIGRDSKTVYRRYYRYEVGGFTNEPINLGALHLFNGAKIIAMSYSKTWNAIFFQLRRGEDSYKYEIVSCGFNEVLGLVGFTTHSILSFENYGTMNMKPVVCYAGTEEFVYFAKASTVWDFRFLEMYKSDACLLFAYNNRIETIETTIRTVPLHSGRAGTSRTKGLTVTSIGMRMGTSGNKLLVSTKEGLDAQSNVPTEFGELIQIPCPSTYYEQYIQIKTNDSKPFELLSLIPNTEETYV